MSSRARVSAVSRRALATVAVLLAACSGGGGGGGGPTDPGTPTVTVVANPTAISIVGSATVTATARMAAGAPVPAGSEIRFTTTFGTLDATSVSTDAAGVAVTILRGSGLAGAATVSAQLAGTAASGTARVDVGTGAAIVTVTPQRAVISPTGRTDVEVRVRNGDGTPRANARVQLTTTLGELADRDVRTDAGGIVRVELEATGGSGTAVITARLETGESGEGRVVIGEGRTVSLSTAATAIPLDGATLVTARVAEQGGTPVGSGVTVRLSTDLGRLSDDRPRTNAFGAAESMLLADGRVGVATLRADVDGATGPAEAQVQIGQGFNLTLVADPPEIDSDESTTLRMTLRRPDGVGVAGREILLSTTRGRLMDSRPVTDAQGNATTLLQGNGESGTATVVATVAGAGVSVTITVSISP